MIFDFSFYLTLAVFVTGAITLIDQLFFKKRRQGKKPMALIAYSRDFFPILLIVWGIRSFVIQPYRVPTGSLEPTILPGDFIAVSQFSYGLRYPIFPLGHQVIISVGHPKRGQIALFRYPDNPKMIYVKRVIGLPGDHIVYKDKTLYINGKKQDQKLLYKDVDRGRAERPSVEVREEILNGIKHKIYVQPYQDRPLFDSVDIIVPPGHYFMMGDNRDDSDDSRDWGPVPEENLIGRALGVWMSWDGNTHKIRWNRIGTSLIAESTKNVTR